VKSDAEDAFIADFMRSNDKIDMTKPSFESSMREGYLILRNAFELPGNNFGKKAGQWSQKDQDMIIYRLLPTLTTISAESLRTHKQEIAEQFADSIWNDGNNSVVRGKYLTNATTDEAHLSKISSKRVDSLFADRDFSLNPFEDLQENQSADKRGQFLGSHVATPMRAMLEETATIGQKVEHLQGGAASFTSKAKTIENKGGRGF